jgi:DNA-binding NtrC family response regulator
MTYDNTIHARPGALWPLGDKRFMMRALVIDDDANVGAAIQAILLRHEYETVLAARAHAGIHALQASKFDVVIVDMFMPGMSGLDTIMIIRKKVPGIPIVAMTGFRFRPAKDPAMDFLTLAAQRGATSSLRKPFAPQQLLDAINSSLANTPAMNGLSQ